MDKWQKERKDGAAVDGACVCCAVEDHIGNNKFDYENSNVHKSNKRTSSSNSVYPTHLTNKDAPKDMRGITSRISRGSQSLVRRLVFSFQ